LIKVILQKGRRRGLDGVFIALQPNRLHNDVRAQLTEVVSFQITDKRAAEWLTDFGFTWEDVSTLPPFQFIARNNRGGEVRG
jgi:hypothetical protein